MKLHPRVPIVQRGSIDIRSELNNLYLADTSYEDVLVPVAILKAVLLREMEEKDWPYVSSSLLAPLYGKVNAVVRGAMAEHGLTLIETYQILTDFELSESKYMLRFERHGNFDKEGSLE